jgi:hypothetical protein
MPGTVDFTADVGAEAAAIGMGKVAVTGLVAAAIGPATVAAVAGVMTATTTTDG